MEETSEREKCKHRGITYIHGAELCFYDECMVCKDGMWIEKKINGP